MLKHPCIPCVNEDGDKGQVQEQGEELGGGGGADTRREGLKEHSV